MPRPSLSRLVTAGTRRIRISVDQYRLRPEFDRVQRYLMFAGYPRSGHTLVGSLLDAHKHALVAHELNALDYLMRGAPRDEIYARLVERSRAYYAAGSHHVYDFRVPGQWQGRYEELRVIGDKKGGGSAKTLFGQPFVWRRLRDCVKVPLRVVHVVRNPFDNIATISQKNRLTLDESIVMYFNLAAVNAQLGDFLAPDELIDIRHEDLIADPPSMLTRLAEFAGLEADAGWVRDCSSIIFRKPSYSRLKVRWSPTQIARVESRSRLVPHLGPVTFEVPESARVAETG